MTTKPVSDDQAAASAEDLATSAAPVLEHDRAVTPTGEGRITFKGHTAKAGYPYRVFDGQVQALVDGAWVAAEDSQRVE